MSWHFSADIFNWSFGHEGKGNVYANGDIETWNVDDLGDPHHQQQADAHGQRPVFLFYITPDGGVSDGGLSFSNTGDKTDDQYLQDILDRTTLHISNDDLHLDVTPRVETDTGYGHAWNLAKQSAAEDLKTWLLLLKRPTASSPYDWQSEEFETDVERAVDKYDALAEESGDLEAISRLLTASVTRTGVDPQEADEIGSEWLKRAEGAFEGLNPQKAVFYHVSPRENRERILQEGLLGHERDDKTDSPWDYRMFDYDQPRGNYLFNDYQGAYEYINMLDHRDTSPHGYDIFQVNADGLPVFPDPESSLFDGHSDLGQIYDWQRSDGEWHGNEGDPLRLVTPNHVAPRRIQHHEFVDPNEVHDLDEFYSEDRVPEGWNRLPMTEIPYPGHESKTAYATNHYHWKTGEPCNCGWGRGDDDTIKTAAQVINPLNDEWNALKNRRKYQSDEAQSLLEHLEGVPGNDTFNSYVNQSSIKWIPWLVDQVRKGHLEFLPKGSPGATHRSRLTLTPTVDLVSRGAEGTGVRSWQHWVDWLNSGHGTRRAFNPTHDELPDLIRGVNAWDRAMAEEAANANREEHRKDGKILHRLPDGWTVRDLDTPEALEREGDVMKHCVGSYSRRVGDGSLRVLSLRDPKGDSHVTTGVDFSGAGDLANENEHDFTDGQIYQHFGKGNSEVKPEYNARLRQYFESLPPEQRPISEEQDAYIGGDWDELEHYLKNRGENGETDALGLRTNELADHDYDLQELLKNTVKDYNYSRDRTYDHDRGETLYNFAKSRNQIPELAKALEEQAMEDENERSSWLPFIDPPIYPDGAGFHTMPNPWGGMDEEEEVEAYNRLQDEHGMSPEQVENARQIPEDWRSWYEEFYEDADNENQNYHLQEDPTWNREQHMYELLAPHWGGDESTGGRYVNTPPSAVTAANNDFSGWQPGQSGKGFIDTGGFVQHWVTDEYGNPHHMEMAPENDRNPDMYKRFDIDSDGKVYDIVDHHSQRFNPEDWKQILESHPQFYSSEDSVEQGFGHANNILDKLSVHAKAAAWDKPTDQLSDQEREYVYEAR